ncbi:uncharacterized protein [Nicotiana tomentosiformis]|uniref:uncharacterized protein n=1 Tax=Nicotiana tomentosiformis TaxID=4098 RepID=UPI00388C3686
MIKFRKLGLHNVPHKWPDQIDMLENYMPKLKITKVHWEYSSPGWVKVNTNGASRGNPGRSSIGFVLRNEEGDVLYACGKEVQEGTNSESEAKAMLEALRYCVEHDFILIELHTDSMLITNVVTGVWTVPWSVAAYVEDIKELMAQCNVTVAHNLREGNRLADHLTNFAIDIGPMEAHYF